MSVSIVVSLPRYIFFFFNDTPTTQIYTFPYTTLFRSCVRSGLITRYVFPASTDMIRWLDPIRIVFGLFGDRMNGVRSEEHTSELQSLAYLVCRLLLEKKKALDISYETSYTT